MPIPPDWSLNFTTFVNECKRKAADGAPRELLGDKPFPNFVLTEKAESWEHFLRWVGELDGSWCFRGQQEAAWYLHTSLDRAVEREHSSLTSFTRYHMDREIEARELLHRFQQYAHSYLGHIPP